MKCVDTMKNNIDVKPVMCTRLKSKHEALYTSYHVAVQVDSALKVITGHESRICGLSMNTSIGPILLLCVYMPTNYGDENSRELYMDCLGKLHAMMYDSDIIHTLIAGDFNCSPGSRFFDEFKSFCDDNNMVVSDISRLSNVNTYVSDDGRKCLGWTMYWRQGL